MVCGSSGAQSQTANEIPIEMPVYTVTDLPVLPEPEHWYYGRVEGFEVLVSGGESGVRDLLKQFQRFRQAVDLVWPGVSRPTSPPTLLVLCGRGETFDAFLLPEQRDAERRLASFSLRGRETNAVVVDLLKKDVYGAGTVDVATNLTAEAAVSASEGATNDASGGGTATVYQVDAYRSLYREYIRFLLAAAEPRAPVWFEEGLSQLLVAMEITETSITVGKLEDANVEGAGNRDGDFNATFKDRALLPMAEVFAVERDSPTALNPIGSDWAKQCYAFVHWGLYGEEGRNQKNFLRFLIRAGRETVSEAMAKDCFGLDYAGLQRALRSHAEWTRSKVAGLRAGQGEKIPEPPPVEFRDATQAEIGRIQGDLFTALDRPAQARGVMIIAYMRGERDPELLAGLGVWEATRGDAGKARKFLDLAVKGKTTRARAYVELARLRLAEEKTKAPAGQKLGGAAASNVLNLLYAARTLPPALPEIYRLINATWTASSVTPGGNHLDVLDEGVRTFPRDLEIALGAAALRKRAGTIPEAHRIVRFALKNAGSDEERARIEAFAATLPPVQP